MTKTTAKIIVITPTGEELVATFKTQSEAFLCASLLQSQASETNLVYVVEVKEKNTLKRRMPDNFHRHISFLPKAEQEKIKSMI